MLQNSNSNHNSSDIQILRHHIYEYKKGVRNMVLHTMCSSEQEEAERILEQRGISFFSKEVNPRKVNVFFGNSDCVKVVKLFGNISLSDYSPEQDFILGIMLGYNINLQCKRYLDKKERDDSFPALFISYKKVFLSKSS